MSREQRLRLAQIRAARMSVPVYTAVEISPVTVAAHYPSINELFDGLAAAVDAASEFVWSILSRMLRLLLVASILLAAAGISGAVWRITNDADVRAEISTTATIQAPPVKLCDYDREHARRRCG